ncbi:DMT family transporter [Paenibacillus sp. TC-CSREp1]|uniref:DMT family transporter n=1 Tax=Paenibacillus sp. TC-CSREp1 TaxID=3410089 RepID=UPI003CFBEC67
MTYYIILLISILFEVIGVVFLNLTNGFTVLIPTLLAIFFYSSSIAIYILLTANREVGIVNAVFAGTGTALVTLMGILFFNESVSALKLLGIALIIGGSIAINVKPKKKELI